MPMTRRRFLRSLGTGAAAAAMSGALPRRNARADDAPAGRPNIIFILADDLGYGDLQCLNGRSKIPTPSLNKLAAAGMTFTEAHSGSAVCTPTRYGVLTGRYAWRTRLKRGVLNGYSLPLIEANRMTVASLLKAAGYQTAIVGKWHLGLDFARRADDPKRIDASKPLKRSPNRYGFDYSFIIPASLDFPPYVYVENDRVTQPPTASQQRQGFPEYIRAGERSPDFKPAETLDLLLKRATDYVAERAKTKRPFFLYFPMTAPHKPVTPAKRFRRKSRLGPYGDFIVQVDWTVGQVVGAVEAAGIRRNTLIIVTSDNGSFMFRLAEDATDHLADKTVQGYRASNHTSNHIFRGTKADIYEGGHHVPYLASWPARIAPGSQCDKPICLTDLMATCAAIVGAKLPAGAGEDSFNTLPLMLGRPWASPRAPVIHHSANGTFAVRDGKWKLILSTGSGGREKPTGRPDSKPFRLYDMSTDPRETTDLATTHPQVVHRLTAALKTIQTAGRSR